MPTDYYEVLGVSRDSDGDEIKQAYRRLARRYHPDVCKEEGAEERFKEISNAYAVLSDPRKRRNYDMYGAEGVSGPRGGSVDIFTLFNEVFGASGSPFGNAQARGSDLHYEVTVDLQAVIEGFDAELEVTRQAECDRCGGSGAAPGTTPATCSMCGGRGVVTEQQRTFFGVMRAQRTCPRCHGRGTVITEPCSQCGGDGVVQSTQTVLVEIPPGIQDGQRIRMAGHGDVPPGGGIPGDLIIGVRVQPHPDLNRRDRDLLLNLDISFSQAALGDQVTVPTVEGEAGITIPPGSQTGDTVALDGQGLPPLHGGRRGRQIVNLHVTTPTDLDEQQRRLLMELALRRGESIDPPQDEGLLQRIKRVLSGEA